MKALLAALGLAVVLAVPAHAEPSWPNWTCGQVGGVFVAHGTDGRGDCEPADPRPACHVPPAEQAPNYLPALTMTPPFPGGTLDSLTSLDIKSPQTTNKECWRVPPE